MRQPWPLFLLIVVAAILDLGCRPRSSSLECLAPANPGGGWDLTCRSLASALRTLEPDASPMRVENLPGAGGGVALAHAVSERSHDTNVVIAASPATTLRLAQRQFGAFTYQDVRWLAAMATDYGMVVVRSDAPWKNLDELLRDWRADPSQILTAGGSAVGGQDHMKLLLLTRAAGIDPRSVRYVPYDGGGEATTALLGGFVHVVPSDASEALGHFRAGSTRVLAVLSPQRLLPPYDEIPTARELGYSVEWIVWRGFYAPGEISETGYQTWVERLQRVGDSPAWAELRRRNALSEFYSDGSAFEAMVERQIVTFEDLTRSLGLIR